MMFEGDNCDEPVSNVHFLTVAEVWDELTQEIDVLISVTGLTYDVALMILLDSQWNVEDAVSRATDDIMATVTRAGGSIDCNKMKAL